MKNTKTSSDTLMSTDSYSLKQEVINKSLSSELTKVKSENAKLKYLLREARQFILGLNHDKSHAYEDDLVSRIDGALEIIKEEFYLAIDMWTQIKYAIEHHEDDSVQFMKRVFAMTHGINWENDCLLCEHNHTCSKCPLMSCKEPDSAYQIVANKNNSITSRLTACDIIIDVIKAQYVKELEQI